MKDMISKDVMSWGLRYYKFYIQIIQYTVMCGENYNLISSGRGKLYLPLTVIRICLKYYIVILF